MTTVLLTPADAEEERLWRLVAEVCHLLRDLRWLLIGGLMVRLVEAEHGVATSWTTRDVDAVVDPRAVPIATTVAADRLIGVGFEPRRTDDATIYRFERGADIVDVLAPDNLGTRASLITVPPAETIVAPGSNAALRRTRELSVQAGFGEFDVPLPDLLGAILIKARAASFATIDRQKHERDLARLLVLVADPEDAWRELTPKERASLRTVVTLADPLNVVWAGVPRAADGVIALRILASASLE